jgi:cell division septation protein DedD
LRFEGGQEKLAKGSAMSRTKGSSAQPGSQRWRQQPEQDVNAYPEDQYQEPPAPRQGGSPHFPQHAFRNLNTERTAPPAPMQRTTFQRPLAGQQAPSGHDRLSQRLQHTDQRTSTQWPTQPDPSGYDLAHYAPEQPGHGRGQVVHDPYAQQSYMDAAAEGWTGNGWNGQAQGYAEQPMDAGHYGDPNDQDYDYETDEDAPAPRRGPRSYVVVGALVGAIAAGGALAYVYKSLGRSGADGATPVVRAERAPAKAKPADPGGKEMAHTDKKFINRLTDDKSGGSQRFDAATAALASSDTSTAGATESDGAPRKVTTLTVNRDGSMAPPNPSVSLPQNSGAGLSGGVPGMVIDGFNAAPQRPQLRGSAVPVENQAAVAVPAKPQVVAKASPAPEPPQRAPQKPIQREEAAVAAPPSGRPAVAPAAAGAGFVTVLSSQKSRMDALKAFADMQQKYGDILENRTPDVREVDLGEKGVWHRLVVGPPASREAASGVCTQLKAQGYSGCWVIAY